jgi:hypothetical protein
MIAEKKSKPNYYAKKLEDAQNRIAELEATLHAYKELDGAPAVLQNMAKPHFVEVQERPYRANCRMQGKDGLVYGERRNFASDSGYDNNIIDRLMAMTTNCTKELLGVDGKIKTDLLPAFDLNNTLTVTIEIQPGG